MDAYYKNIEEPKYQEVTSLSNCVLYIDLSNMIYNIHDKMNNDKLMPILKRKLLGIIVHRTNCSTLILNLSTYLHPVKWYGVSSSCASSDNYSKCLPVTLDSKYISNLILKVVEPLNIRTIIIPNRMGEDCDITIIKIIENMSINNILCHFPNDTIIDLMLLNDTFNIFLSVFIDKEKKFKFINIKESITNIYATISSSMFSRSSFGPPIIAEGSRFISNVSYEKFKSWIETSSLISKDIFIPNIDMTPSIINIISDSVENPSDHNDRETVKSLIYSRINSFLYIYGRVPKNIIIRNYISNIEYDSYVEIVTEMIKDDLFIEELKKYVFNLEDIRNITTKVYQKYNIIVMMTYCIPGNYINLSSLSSDIIKIFDFSVSPLSLFKPTNGYLIPTIELIVLALKRGLRIDIETDKIYVKIDTIEKEFKSTQNMSFIKVDTDNWTTYL